MVDDKKDFKVEIPTDVKSLVTLLKNLKVPLSDFIYESLESGVARDNNRYGGPLAFSSGEIGRALVVMQSDPEKFTREVLNSEFASELSYSLYSEGDNNVATNPSYKLSKLRQMLTEQAPNAVPEISSLLSSAELPLPMRDYLVLVLQIFTEVNKGNVDSFDAVNQKEEQLRWDNCKDAETYFLNGLNTRFPGDYVTIHDNGKPLILQKVGSRIAGKHLPQQRSSNATGVTLVPLAIGGILYPAGTLVGVLPKDDTYIKRDKSGSIDKSEIKGVYPLRMTHLISNRPEEDVFFGAHLKEYSDTFKDLKNSGSLGNMQSYPDLDFWCAKARSLLNKKP